MTRSSLAAVLSVVAPWVPAALAGLTVVAAAVATRSPRDGLSWARTGGAAAPAPAGRRGGGVPRWAVGLGLVVGLGLATITVGAVTTALVGVGVVAARVRAVRGVARRRQRSIDTAVPDLVDLFVIAASAGQTVPGCLHLVTARAPVVVRPALERARHRVDKGVPVAVALESLGPELGHLGPTLAGALITSAATGAPLVSVLTGVAATARDRRRRSAEAAARRLPVTLLFPLVCCILPAFALLAVVPLLAASLSSLHV